jgi:general secretion pathway protein A
VTSPNKVLSRYNLNRSPFGKEIDADDLLVTEDWNQTKARLRAALEARSSVAILGESGSGKTSLFRAVEAELPTGNYRTHYIANSMVNHRDFYRQLSMELGLEAKTTAAALFSSVSRHFAQVATDQRARSVLVLDEAHLLPAHVLAHLHILLNYERDSKPWLTLVLIGLPELRGLLARDTLASLSTRLPTRLTLKLLDAAGVREYVAHRLAKAGARTQIFSEDATLLIAEATRGVMRKIDVLANQSLIEGMATKGTVVDATAVTRAIEVVQEVLR